MSLLYSMFSVNNRSYKKHVLPHLSGSVSNDLMLLVDSSLAFKYDSFQARVGEWSKLWDVGVDPSCKMPPNSKFTESFDDVSDRSAYQLLEFFRTKNKNRIIVYYSGGIDSTIVVCSILRNFSTADLKYVDIALSMESIIENPYFYEHYIKPNFNVVNSAEHFYGDRSDAVYVSADSGDAMFGTELGLKFYQWFDSLNHQLCLQGQVQRIDNFDPTDTHYSKIQQELILFFNNLRTPIQFDNFTPADTGYNFGKEFYSKVEHNIRTSGFTIETVHDFFWWIIFNLKYVHCALRPAVLYNFAPNKKAFIEDSLYNWFGNAEYQLWSINNNNTGLKIKGSSPATYKFAGREYIYKVDGNTWYKHNKTKLASLPSIIVRNYKDNFSYLDTVFGIDSESYDSVHIDGDQFKTMLTKFV